MTTQTLMGSAIELRSDRDAHYTTDGYAHPGSWRHTVTIAMHPVHATIDIPITAEMAAAIHKSPERKVMVTLTVEDET